MPTILLPVSRGSRLLRMLNLSEEEDFHDDLSTLHRQQQQDFKTVAPDAVNMTMKETPQLLWVDW